MKPDYTEEEKKKILEEVKKYEASGAEERAVWNEYTLGNEELLSRLRQKQEEETSKEDVAPSDDPEDDS